VFQCPILILTFVKKKRELVIEYVKDKWRDTDCWTVLYVYDSVDKLAGTTCSLGHVRLYDKTKAIYGGTNYLDSVQKGDVILKIPDASRKWSASEELSLQEMRNSSRKRKSFVKNEEESQVNDSPRLAISNVVVSQSPVTTPKKRGRPKGSKNKSTLAREAAMKEKGGIC
jgi:hypothetical protein